MSLRIVHASPGRVRVRFARAPGVHRVLLLAAQALHGLGGVRQAQANPRSGSLLVLYGDDPALRQTILRRIEAAAQGEAPPVWRGQGAGETKGRAGALPAGDARACAGACVPAPGFGGAMMPLVWRFLLPRGLRPVFALRAALPRLWRGVASLFTGKLSVDVLDAAALGLCIVRRDFRSLGSITLLLSAAEFLEGWTRRRSEESLVSALLSQTVWAWVRRGDEEQRVDARLVQPGDVVIVRQGAVAPVDGLVEEGEALFDQSSMTGEVSGVPKRPGSAVFAGTVALEGEVAIAATKAAGATRWRRMLALVEQAQSSKADVQSQAERLAEKLVPFSLGLAGLVWAITRDPRRAAAVLLVDYSCAIKLATPLTVLAAMRQMAAGGWAVKSGQSLENLAKADVFVFDKTGTLTMAEPSMHQVVSFNGHSRGEVLRLAACLEEHFPHPVARAVVLQAKREGLVHREEHSRVEYVAAHGVASSLKGARVLLGSRHFVHDDGKIPLGEAGPVAGVLADKGHSILYLAIGNELAGIIALDDPLRPEAAQALRALRATGARRIIMLTGDLDGMAARVARTLGITEWFSQMLPDEKYQCIEKLMEEGNTVAMVGDGMNDAPALAKASVGISMHQGADITREVADVVLASGGLTGLAAARVLAQEALRRIRNNYRLIVGVNTVLLAAGLTGRLTPQLSALLHNGGTLAAAVNAIRPLQGRLDAAPPVHKHKGETP